jgi:hypothetical protein
VRVANNSKDFSTGKEAILNSERDWVFFRGTKLIGFLNNEICTLADHPDDEEEERQSSLNS